MYGKKAPAPTEGHPPWVMTGVRPRRILSTLERTRLFGEGRVVSTEARQQPFARVPVSTGWVGWIWFAGLALILVGTFNVIHGLVAVFEDDVLVAAGETLAILDLTAWGWVHAVAGALQIVVGCMLFTGARWARITAIVVVMLNAVAQLAALNAQPTWAIVIIALDVVVLWALVVHGEEARAGISV